MKVKEYTRLRSCVLILIIILKRIRLAFSVYPSIVRQFRRPHVGSQPQSSETLRVRVSVFSSSQRVCRVMNHHTKSDNVSAHTVMAAVSASQLPAQNMRFCVQCPTEPRTKEI